MEIRIRCNGLFWLNNYENVGKVMRESDGVSSQFIPVQFITYWLAEGGRKEAKEPTVVKKILS